LYLLHEQQKKSKWINIHWMENTRKRRRVSHVRKSPVLELQGGGNAFYFRIRAEGTAEDMAEFCGPACKTQRKCVKPAKKRGETRPRWCPCDLPYYPRALQELGVEMITPECKRDDDTHVECVVDGGGRTEHWLGSLSKTFPRIAFYVFRYADFPEYVEYTLKRGKKVVVKTITDQRKAEAFALKHISNDVQIAPSDEEIAAYDAADARGEAHSVLVTRRPTRVQLKSMLRDAK
jgi:hypothetical protein